MSSQAGGEVLQSPQLHQELANISSIEIRETHCVPPIKYLEVGDDKQPSHTFPKPCKGPHIEGLACQGHQTDANCKLQRSSSLVHISFLSALRCL
jgi:hypothetical protein